jgi:predicted nucleic acid-binding protein
LIVLDASAVIEWLLNRPVGARVATRVSAADGAAYAPHLLDVEVAQVLRRYALARELNVERAAAALADFTALRLNRVAHDVLLTRIWELRDSLSAYDAAYVALAEALDAPLLTCDAKLARSHGHDAQIELLA